MRRQRREDSVLSCFSHEYVWLGQATPTVLMRETRIYGRSAAKEVLALSCVCVCGQDLAHRQREAQPKPVSSAAKAHRL